MLEAILFDWGNTLARFTWSEELLEAGHRAGLEAIGRGAAAELTERYRTELLPRLREPDARLTVDYRAEVERLLGGGDVDAFLEAEHEAWAPATELAATTHALLEALRRRGLALGLVLNAWPDPPHLLRRQIERLGVAERVDAVVLSADVGAYKPDPRPFLAALDRLGVPPAAALFVGDSLAADVAGARNVGMRTVQALWFRADPDDAPEPDFQAFTQMDVLNIARRLSG